MRAERSAARAQVWWARLVGVVAGLAGLGIAGLASWAVAPLGSPVPAVGQLIINILPGPLVNFGKETLGTADKPVLLGIIVAGVLVLCGLAGQLELRHRFAGAAVFGLVAVLGIIGISAQPGVTINAYLPIVIGLVLGYIIMSSLINLAAPLAAAPGRRADRGRPSPPPGGASSAGRSWSACWLPCPRSPARPSRDPRPR